MFAFNPLEVCELSRERGNEPVVGKEEKDESSKQMKLAMIAPNYIVIVNGESRYETGYSPFECILAEVVSG
jgi:hypothetical protein